MHNLEAVALRYANVYGPRQNPHGEAGAVAIFARAIMAGHPFTINGDGGQTRDYTYVADVVKANLLAATFPVEDRVPILNVGTGIEASVNDLVTVLQETVGRPLLFQRGPAKPGEQRRSALDGGMAKQLLGWQPTVDLRAGLARTMAWFRDTAVRDSLAGPRSSGYERQLS